MVFCDNPTIQLIKHEVVAKLDTCLFIFTINMCIYAMVKSCIISYYISISIYIYILYTSYDNMPILGDGHQFEKIGVMKR